MIYREAILRKQGTQHKFVDRHDRPVLYIAYHAASKRGRPFTSDCANRHRLSCHCGSLEESLFTKTISSDYFLLIQTLQQLCKPLQNILRLPPSPYPTLSLPNIQPQRLPHRRRNQHLLPLKCQTRHRRNRVHLHRLQHLPQLPRTLRPAVPAITHDHRRLPHPLVEQVVDRVLERRRIPPVVLRGDEDEGRVAADLAGPLSGVFFAVEGGVVDALGDGALVEEGEGPGGEIDEVEGEGGGVGVGALDYLLDEGGDLGAGAGGAGRGEDDANSGRGCV